MTRAVDHANHHIENWSEKAYLFLLSYIENVGEFMAEDVRKASEGIIAQPPNLRAWGAILVRAAKAGIIKRTGFGTVTNVNAHRCFASKWRRV